MIFCNHFLTTLNTVAVLFLFLSLLGNSGLDGGSGGGEGTDSESSALSSSSGASLFKSLLCFLELMYEVSMLRSEEEPTSTAPEVGESSSSLSEGITK